MVGVEMTAKHNNALAFVKSIFIYPSIQKYFKKEYILTKTAGSTTLPAKTIF